MADVVPQGESQVATTGELLFRDPPATSGALLFGDDSTAPPALSDATLEIAGAFPALTARVLVSVSTEARITGQFAPLTVTAFGEYDSDTQRPLVCKASAPWQVAVGRQAGVTWAHQDAAPAPAGSESLWQPATSFGAHFATRHQDTARLRQRQEGRYQDATGLYNGASSSHQDAERIKRLAAVAYQNATNLRAGQQFRHQEGTRIKRALTARLQTTTALRRLFDAGFQVATPAFWGWDARHQDAVPPPPGISKGPGPKPKPEPCYTPNARLLFADPWEHSATLLFACTGKDPESPPPPDAAIVVPIRKAYIVMNEARLFKVDGGLELPVTSMSLDLDMSSWAWGFNATLPGSTLGDLLSSGTNSPIELEAVVNGEHFLLLAEKVSRSRSFGQSNISVSGRGRSAYLSSPYSPKQNFSVPAEVTAQQLMNNLLTFNGVPLGWNIDWQITDWLVPAGVWSNHGTYMDGLANIASAVGAFILPHKTDKTLSIKAMYETLPWEWAATAPDFELPAAVIQTESVKWEEYPDYNGVYVSGASQGVIGWVKRIGSAGNYLAPMVTDPLITTADAARMRGRNILSGTGKKAILTLNLPILPETGIITPGNLIRYNDNGTLVTGVTKSVSVSTEIPKIRQTIEVEAHV